MPRKRKRTKKTDRYRRRLHTANKELAQKSQDAIDMYSRQISYEDEFQNLYNATSGFCALRPPYSPEKMYELYEETGILQACIEAYVQNIDSFGSDVVPVAGVLGEEEQEQEHPQKVLLADFLAAANPDDSFITVRKRIRRDLEVTGNGYMEVVRYSDGIPSLVFWADAKKVRLTVQDDEYVPMTVQMKRGVNTVPVIIRKYFRKFIMSYKNNEFRYFKEYGDPRTMNAYTGEVFDTPPELDSDGTLNGTPFRAASEIFHFKHGNGLYGIPRWTGTILSVMGISRAEFVNFDLFDNQGIPPMIVSLTGGQLTDESWDDLLALLRRAKGTENFHKVLVLEAESTSSDLNGREVPPKLEIKNLTEMRKEDAMFASYLADSRKTVRQYGFRLPGMFVGEQNDFNYATAKVCQETAEAQVFAPERLDFDTQINQKLLPDMGIDLFRIRSRGATNTSSGEALQLLPHLINGGAFTVNELIAFANEHFDLNMNAYDEQECPWAGFPIAFARSGAGSVALDLPATDDAEEEEEIIKSVKDLRSIILKFARRNNEIRSEFVQDVA